MADGPVSDAKAVEEGEEVVGGGGHFGNDPSNFEQLSRFGLAFLQLRSGTVRLVSF
jgi:hypothetical protein